MKLKIGDLVSVTSGKDSGREGKITHVLPAESLVVVEGVNRYKRHIKPKGQGQKGQIVQRTRPIDVAKVALICPKCKQLTRVGYRIDNEGGKVRICRKCEEQI